MNGPHEVVFFDHTGTPGGGQLETLRLLPRLTSLKPRAIFITGGPVLERLRSAEVDTTLLVPHQEFRAWRVAYYAFRTWQALRGVPRETPIIALSTAAAQVLAFLPRNRRVRILRLNEDLERFSGRGWRSLLYFGWIFRRYDGFVANSRWTAETIPASLRHVPTTVAYSLSGVPARLGRPEPALAHPDVRVACFSRSARWKGLDLAIRAVRSAAEQGHSVSLRLFGGEWQGEVDYRDELRRLADRSVAQITFEGHVDDVLQIMSEIDVVIMPSRLPEPFGQVTVQSLAAGCLTIVSNHGGSLELVENEKTGLTFENDDAVDLTRALIWALDHRQEAMLVAQAGASAAQLLNDRNLAGRLEDAIAQLLPSHGVQHQRRKLARGGKHE